MFANMALSASRLAGTGDHTSIQSSLGASRMFDSTNELLEK